MKYIDYTGMKLGDFEIIERIGTHITPSGQRKPLWKCKCNKCGKISNITSQDIKRKISRNITDCGTCGLDPITGKNRYEIYDDYVIGYTSKQEPFFIDREDYDLVKNYTWHKNDQNYIVYKQKSCGNLRMHRLIMGHYYDIDGMDIDHIRSNSRNDNRKGNLRVVTRSQNNMNRNTYKGVYYSSYRQKWVAHIVINGWNNYLGYFDNYEDALECRKKGEQKYFKENSYDYSQKIALEELV